MSKKALCIISDGMDSTLCAYLTKKEGYEIIALHFNYEQRTQEREKECFKQICKALKIEESYILDVSLVKDIGGNALTDKSTDIPENEPCTSDIPPITYMPFRNGTFLSMTGSLAEKENCKSIFIGVVGEDGSGYPDRTNEFIQKAQELISEDTSKNFRVRIKTPPVKLNKAKIAELVLEENVPLELTWSYCESEGEICGEYDSCLFRLRSFERAGFKDKIKYKS